jgi:uncharacterized protein
LTKKIYAVKKSPVHGNGVFAATAIAKGTKIIEYRGELIANEEVENRGSSDPKDEFHTFFFSLSDEKNTLDAAVRGSAARWINHHCQPNCKSGEEEEANGRLRVYIYAKRDIKLGEELNYDYRLTWDGRMTKQDRLNYECRCGAKKCRRTMLWIEPAKLKAEAAQKAARKTKVK